MHFIPQKESEPEPSTPPGGTIVIILFLFHFFHSIENLLNLLMIIADFSVLLKIINRLRVYFIHPGYERSLKRDYAGI